jgi:hypothetical protein
VSRAHSLLPGLSITPISRKPSWAPPVPSGFVPGHDSSRSIKPANDEGLIGRGKTHCWVGPGFSPDINRPRSLAFRPWGMDFLEFAEIPREKSVPQGLKANGFLRMGVRAEGRTYPTLSFSVPMTNEPSWAPLLPPGFVSGHDFTGCGKSHVLYQGTTLVVP